MLRHLNYQVHHWAEAELIVVATDEDMFQSPSSPVHIIRSHALQIEGLMRQTERSSWSSMGAMGSL